MMSADALIEAGSIRLRRLSEIAAARGGLAERLAQPLADDAAFLRKLKPSLIKARAKGEAPTDQRPDDVPAPTITSAGGGRNHRGSSKRNPIPLIVAALGAGIVFAKVLDWRGHAHPRN
jgi:hypothetical protein